MKKSKKTEETLNPLLTLRFKLTNLRQSNFPDPLTETDYFGFKVGDLLQRGDRRIYKIVDIRRTGVAAGTLLGWLTSAKAQKPQDTKLVDLLKKYIDSNNYGMCEIDSELVLKDGEASKRKVKHVFLEGNMIKIWNPYFDTQRADIKSLIGKKELLKGTLVYRRDDIQSKIDIFDKEITGLKNLLNTGMIEVIDSELKAVGQFNAALLATRADEEYPF